MKWPWQRSTPPEDRLAFGIGPTGLAWVLTDEAGARPQVRRCGLLARPEQPNDWPAAMKSLGLVAADAIAQMALPDYQLLQIDAPSVPQEELRAAARWRIREMIEGHVDEVTIDVMRVGQPRSGAGSAQPLFVVAAKTTEVQSVGHLARQAGWPLSVIDVTDTGQRNLQCAAAAELDLSERATACLVRHGRACLLTLCVGEELYYSRRLDWDTRLPELARQMAESATATQAPQGEALAIELGGLHMGDESPRLLTELQRSFDVWERSWPDLPLALMMLHTGDDTPLLADYLQERLGLRVLPLNLSAGLDIDALRQAPEAVRSACTPLLGALLRERATTR